MPDLNDARARLRKVFGYEAFRPGQEEAVSAILSGRDLMAVMPTGAGKSVCYQIPALLLPGVTVVVSPLISLMGDQVEALRRRGVSVAQVNSAMPEGSAPKICWWASQGAYRVLYVAPERLSTPSMIRFAARARVAQIVVDEAHCVSQWGQDFRPAYLEIKDYIDLLPQRPRVSAFTATATPRVREDIERLLGLRDPVRVTTGFDRPNLYFEVRHPEGDRDDELVRFVKGQPGQCGIVYCGTRRNTEAVARLLRANGIPASAYHAGKLPERRAAVQEAFVSGRTRVIVATNAFGMGIDKPDVRFVVHYNMPKDLESYVQEAGRAGRDGEAATCLLLYDKSDQQLCRRLIAHSGALATQDEAQRRALKAAANARLKEMTRYATGRGCLRARYLRYFGEDAPRRCGNCSRCLRRGDAAPLRERIVLPADAPDVVHPSDPDARPLPPPVEEMDDVYVRLTRVRRDLALERGVPPFMIFSNRTLMEMAKQRPETEREMLTVYGVGPRKMAQYGDAFLQEFARLRKQREDWEKG